MAEGYAVTQCGECGKFTEGRATECAWCEEEFVTVATIGDSGRVGYGQAIGCMTIVTVAIAGMGFWWMLYQLGKLVWG